MLLLSSPRLHLCLTPALKCAVLELLCQGRHCTRGCLLEGTSSSFSVPQEHPLRLICHCLLLLRLVSVALERLLCHTVLLTWIRWPLCFETRHAYKSEALGSHCPCYVEPDSSLSEQKASGAVKSHIFTIVILLKNVYECFYRYESIYSSSTNHVKILQQLTHWSCCWSKLDLQTDFTN